MMWIGSFVLTFWLGFVSPAGAIEADLKHMPIQDAGRVKPFDSFAREALQLVYGRKTYQSRDPVVVVWTWMLVPEFWRQQELVEINHAGLKQSLQLDPRRKRFTPEELASNDRVGLYFKELVTKRSAKERLDSFFNAVQRLENQLAMFHSIRVGEALRLVPPDEGSSSTAWRSVLQLEGDLKAQFGEIASAFVKIAVSEMQMQDGRAAPSDKAAAEAQLKDAVARFQELARSENPVVYDHQTRIGLEVFLNEFHPFLWAWVLYLVAALLLLAHLFRAPVWTYRVAWVFVILGFLLHTLGFALRVYILGRAPVTNMYETVVYVPWGAMIFAMIFDRWMKNKVILAAAALVACLCMIVADLAPSVLDPSLHPLEPVLRDNFWLVTHVMMITISYGAFFLALMLGNISLFCYLLDENKFKVLISSTGVAIYRCLNVGVVLLAAGTILGGIWADYSWGRFWGWDPKETWALIALLGYLALLHGRLIGWVRDFGMAAGSIIAFALVIFAWYGVNFVLGAGLHSYGFGAGGVEWVAGFVGVHLLYVAYVALVRHNRRSPRT